MTLLQKASRSILKSEYGSRKQLPYKCQRPCNISTTLYNLKKKENLGQLAREDHQEKVYVPTKLTKGMF